MDDQERVARLARRADWWAKWNYRFAAAGVIWFLLVVVGLPVLVGVVVLVVLL